MDFRQILQADTCPSLVFVESIVLITVLVQKCNRIRQGESHLRIFDERTSFWKFPLMMLQA